MAHLLRRFATDFRDLIYPGTCLACGGAAGGDWCPVCLEQLERIREPICSRCGTWMSIEIQGASERNCDRCKASPPPYVWARSVFRYDRSEPIRELLLGAKHRGDPTALSALADLLVDSWAGLDLRYQPDLVVPIPLHWSRRMRRGFNQAEELSRAVARRLGARHEPRVLVRQRRTASQSGGRSVRRENVCGAFRAQRRGLLIGRTIILVDDVYTTGATLAECSDVLLKQGADSVAALTLARAPDPVQRAVET